MKRLVQVLLPILIASSLTEAIDHPAYHPYQQPPTYHHIPPTAPTPSKPATAAVSFASLITHHSQPAKPDAHFQHNTATTPVLTAPAAGYQSAPASSYASFSSPIFHLGAKPIPIVHYAHKPVVGTSFAVVQPRVAPVVQVAQHVAAPIAHESHQEINYNTEPKYEFSYGIEDAHTGDKKSHHEQRDGDHTQGQYSLVEPDGTILTVDYSVTGKSGFNAVVHRSGHAVHPQLHHKSHP